MDGILYHTYAPADTTATTGNSNSSSAQSNPYHGGNTAATTNTNTNNNQNTTTTSGNSAVKEVRFVVYKEGSSDPVNIKDPRKDLKHQIQVIQLLPTMSMLLVT